MRVAILSHRIAHYDAVSMDARLQCRLLNAAGFEARLFAQSWEDLQGIAHVAELAAFVRQTEHVVLLHYATAWPEVLPLLRELPGRIILRYHNITPPEYFEDHNAAYTAACREGLLCLQDLIRAHPDLLYWSVSEFNQQDLLRLIEQAGIPRPAPQHMQVVPPQHQVAEFLEREADLAMLRNLQLPPRDILLNVGRVVPNKNHRLLLEAFALYRNFNNPSALLLIAGKRDEWLQEYSAGLQELMQQHNLQEAVIFAEDLTAAELKACYLSARLLCSTSLHEGFGVPLIEAQALGLPVLALDRAAVAATVGAGALLLAEADPALFAAAMHRMVEDASLQQALRQAGFQNYHDRFRPAQVAREFLAQMQSLYQTQVPGPIQVPGATQVSGGVPESDSRSAGAS